MTKGKRITIYTESIDRHGVVTATTIAAKVEYSHGDNVTVKGNDGYIYEIDATIRNDNGHYKVF